MSHITVTVNYKDDEKEFDVKATDVGAVINEIMKNEAEATSFVFTVVP